MDKDGHEIANHTWTHTPLNKITWVDLVSEINKTQSLILKLTGKVTRYYRLPGSSLKVVKKVQPPHGYDMVLWDIHSHDQKAISSQQIQNEVLKQVKDGDIVLFHNGLPNSIEALDSIIPSLKARGFELVTVTELIDRKET